MGRAESCVRQRPLAAPCGERPGGQAPRGKGLESGEVAARERGSRRAERRRRVCGEAPGAPAAPWPAATRRLALGEVGLRRGAQCTGTGSIGRRCPLCRGLEPPEGCRGNGDPSDGAPLSVGRPPGESLCPDLAVCLLRLLSASLDAPAPLRTGPRRRSRCLRLGGLLSDLLGEASSAKRLL